MSCEMTEVYEREDAPGNGSDQSAWRLNCYSFGSAIVYRHAPPTATTHH